MRKILFTEHLIITVLKSVKAGITAKDVCREAAIYEASYYKLKAKCGVMEVENIKKNQGIGEGNRSLKQMFTDLNLENRAL